MKILITNDDGINAIGIKKIEQLMKPYGEVFVCAPNVEQSGKSCSLTCYIGCKAYKLDSHHIMCEGSPADCVEVGMVLFNEKFDLVVSGCNNGFNASNDIMYSGTCGACLQALLSSIPAIAFSTKMNSDFDKLDHKVPFVMDYILKNNLLSNKYFLNVNIGYFNAKDEIVLTHPANRTDEKYYIVSEKNDYYVINRCDAKIENDDECDLKVIEDGKISISPISNTYFKAEDLKDLKQKIID